MRVFAALLGVLIFGERPGAGTLVGGVLIIAGGFLLARVSGRRDG